MSRMSELDIYLSRNPDRGVEIFDALEGARRQLQGARLDTTPGVLDRWISVGEIELVQRAQGDLAFVASVVYRRTLLGEEQS